MYLSICKKDFNGIMAGELFDTYQEINYAFIREKGTNQKFQCLPFQEYSSYFASFEDSVFLPTIRKEKRFRGLLKKRENNVYIKEEKLLIFENLHFDDLKQMQLSIFEPVKELSKIGGFENWTGGLYKKLKHIEDLSKKGLLMREDLQKSIKKSEMILEEIEGKIKKQLLEC